MTAVYIGNMVEANGKTVKENNLAMQHSYPIGSLVELDDETSPSHGVRLFVVGHDRDFDGTPNYTLGARMDCFHRLEDYKKMLIDFGWPEVSIRGICDDASRYGFIGGKWEEDLILIREPKND